ncbi:sugar ABC transporter ATP-binding protein [Sphingomonas gei]|uniref:Sugar ABC transporter ATP-binding protein n=1 Tax=Sphingomonas gei TaxID=1395960 RepID=A0A4S1XGH1_9SPHN|nr:sugar ABC transporter ATP-binding protein [Sphingomonas gei]TGX55704.1 sugar ABC transporter ATP-binding protein [Sphingomonas gei]
MALLEARGVAKRFPNGTVALAGVDLVVEPGRVHGLLGANGAGKSTLIKILSGVLAPSDGVMLWRGEPARWRKPIEARRAGIATIQQHIPLVPTLSVRENILLDRGGMLREAQGDRDEICALLARIDCTIDPEALVGELRIGDRQMVAIAQALASGAELVIMDEPTASLAGQEREAVYRIIRRLAHEEGRAVLFISHFLDEIVALTDTITVLRDGGAVLDAETATIGEAEIAAAIAGEKLNALERTHRASPTGEVALAIEGLATPHLAQPVDLTLRRGEIVGVAGLLGSGRSELLHAIFGSDRHARGAVSLDGKAVGRSPEEAVEAGIALVAEERVAQGLVPGFEIWRNLSLPHVGASGWLLDEDAERAAAERAVERLAIKAAGIDTPVTELSGGNAQKVTIARWLHPSTRLLLLDEPSAGIDVGARTEIMRLIRQLADEGLPILLVSSDFSELLALADRVLVLRDRGIVADRPAADLDEDALILLAGGSAGSDNREIAA